MSDEFEELEQIPWSALAAKTPDMRRRLGAIVAVAVVTLAAGFLFMNGRAPTTTEVTPAALDAAGPAGQDITVITTDPPPTAVSSPSSYSEADLMAISVEDETRLVEMHAEWFVRDYLTIDGEQTTMARIESLIPVELSDSAPGVSTYVEWIDTVAVTSPRPGTYVVEVAYSLLVADGGPYTRLPVGGLAVSLAVGSDGGVELAGLPTVIDAPATRPLREVPAGGVGVLELIEGASRPVASAALDPSG